jgi:hypothetical protein
MKKKKYYWKVYKSKEKRDFGGIRLKSFTILKRLPENSLRSVKLRRISLSLAG